MMFQPFILVVAVSVMFASGCAPPYTEYAYCVMHPHCVALIQTKLQASKAGRWESVNVEQGPKQEVTIEIKLLSDNGAVPSPNSSDINAYCKLVNNAVSDLGLRGNVTIRIINWNGIIVEHCSRDYHQQ